MLLNISHRPEEEKEDIFRKLGEKDIPNRESSMHNAEGKEIICCVVRTIHCAAFRGGGSKVEAVKKYLILRAHIQCWDRCSQC